MKLTIDQSGKIEETHRDTILAATNGLKRTIRITAKTKRRLQNLFRQIGEPKTFVITIFIIAIYELIGGDISRIDQIVIDTEYPGYESTIRKVLTRMINEYHPGSDLSIDFASVGKKAQAHWLAKQTFRKRAKADKMLGYDYCLKRYFIYKNGYPVLKYLYHFREW